MKISAFLSAALVLATTAHGPAHAASHTAAVPAAAASPIQPPADERAAFTWGARGTQNYECKANDKGGFAWAFVAPQADLFSPQGAKMGTHGAGPFWLALDGSKVNGSVKARADAPTGTAIPWLLLGAQSTGGVGVLTAVTHIQRINTVGGTAPADGCASAADVGKQVRQPYTADYVYFVKP